MSNVIVRETRFGALARIVDQLPPRIATSVFVFLWLVFLQGWCVPLILDCADFATPSADLETMLTVVNEVFPLRK
jgi:hypothetical protein